MDLADVLGIPPLAIGLNGDLALAFGARGRGLNSARAHYEHERAVINLTKEKGAGSLAHEWFHALDHYFGRQDGKASSQWETRSDGTRTRSSRIDMRWWPASQWETRSDGTRTLKSKGAEGDMVSHGFGYKSSVREELRAAYDKVIETIFKKATTYVEDTQRSDQFVARAKEDLAQRLDALRKSLSEQKDPTYWKRNNKPASAEQLAQFDTIAKRMLDGEAQALTIDWRHIDSAKARTSRWTNDSLEQLSALYKAVRGRSGFDSQSRSGVMDRIAQNMKTYGERLKMLADAQSGAQKIKMVPTDFAMNAKELDQGRGENYWTTPHEVAARAFQGYVEDKVAEQGNVSRFLNYAPENAGILTPWGVKRPYPAGAERKAINAALDAFVQALQTKETDRGVMIFSPSYAYTAEVSPASGVHRAQSPRRGDLAPRSAPVPIDLFSTENIARTAQHAAKQLARFATVARPVRVGTFRAGVERVDTPQAAAHVFAPLRKSTIEQGFVLVLDAQHRPLAMLRVGIGARSQTSIFPSVIAQPVHSIPDARWIWFAHNHPSGVTFPSRADEHLTQVIEQTLRDTGVELAGHIIVAGTSEAFHFKGAVPEGSVAIQPAARRREIPVMETRYVKNAKLLDETVDSPASAKRMITQIAGRGRCNLKVSTVSYYGRRQGRDCAPAKTDRASART